MSLGSRSRLCDAMEFETGSHAFRVGNGGASFGDMSCQTVDSTLGEVLSALLARMRVSIAVVVQLGPALEVLEDQRVRSASHCGLLGAFPTVARFWDASFTAETPFLVRGSRYLRQNVSEMGRLATI